MFKNARSAHLLKHHFRPYMLTAIFLSLTLLPAAFGQETPVTDAVTEGSSRIWGHVKLYGTVTLVIFFFFCFLLSPKTVSER